MKKLGYSVAVAALAAFMTTTAYAADVEVMPEAVANWTGFHIGAGGGVNFAFSDDFTNAYHDHVNNGDFIDGEITADLGDEGFFGTVEGGFDWQLNSIVIGALANYDFGKTKMDTQSDASFNNNGNFNSSGELETSLEIGDSWAVGGRLGLLATDSTLFYVVGGYTEAKVTQEAELTANNHSDTSLSDSNWESGYFVGGGIETLLTDNISLKGEYRFADYGKVKNETGDFGNHNNNNFHDGVEHSSDLTVHSVRAVLSFRF